MVLSRCIYCGLSAIEVNQDWEMCATYSIPNVFTHCDYSSVCVCVCVCVHVPKYSMHVCLLAVSSAQTQQDQLAGRPWVSWRRHMTQPQNVRDKYHFLLFAVAGPFTPITIMITISFTTIVFVIAVWFQLIGWFLLNNIFIVIVLSVNVHLWYGLPDGSSVNSL